ncbi:MAG: hypothetical protein CL927_08520 [Deltaproteobacteria bacterium]|nr:hypothetical protein [Deltaproteobacteria bacterium]
MPLPLFVYGSLLQGQPSDGYLASRRIRPATVRGRLYRVPAGYPALVLDPEGSLIHGELVMDVEPGLLVVLDLFEGVRDGLYQRVPVSAFLRSPNEGQQALFAEPVSAQAYVVTHHQARVRRYHPLKVTDWRTVAPRPR